MAMIGLYVLYALAIPGAALATCVKCRRPWVLPLLGSPLVVLMGLFIVSLRQQEQVMDVGLAVAIGTYLAAPLLAAGVILVVGGVVRWGAGRRREQGGTAGPVTGPEPPTPPADEGRDPSVWQ